MTAKLVDRTAALLKRTAVWAWQRDEVGVEATRETLRHTVVLYAVALVVIVASGAGLAAFGHPAAGFAVLLFGIWFTAFIGAINIGWEFLKLRANRRRAEAPAVEPAGPTRELAPGFELAEDTKIGFVVTVLALLVLFVAFELARWLVGVL